MGCWWTYMIFRMVTLKTGLVFCHIGMKPGVCPDRRAMESKVGTSCYSNHCPHEKDEAGLHYSLYSISSRIFHPFTSPLSCNRPEPLGPVNTNRGPIGWCDPIIWILSIQACRPYGYWVSRIFGQIGNGIMPRTGRINFIHMILVAYKS